jgi:hypothetical protein
MTTYFDITNGKLFVGSSESNSNTFQVGLTTGNYIGFDGTNINMVSNNINISGGSINISSSDSSIKFTETANDSYITLNSNKIKLGKNAISTANGLYLADNATIGSANNAISLNVDDGTFIIKSQGTVDVSNTNNSLYFGTLATDSYIRMNSNKIKIGNSAIGSESGIYVADNSTWSSATNGIQIQTTGITPILNMKSDGIIDISNNTNFNRLYMGATNSRLHLNTNGTATDTDILQLGDDTTTSYLKYNGSDLIYKGIVSITSGDITINTPTDNNYFKMDSTNGYLYVGQTSGSNVGVKIGNGDKQIAFNGTDLSFGKDIKLNGSSYISDLIIDQLITTGLEDWKAGLTTFSSDLITIANISTDYDRTDKLNPTTIVPYVRVGNVPTTRYSTELVRIGKNAVKSGSNYYDGIWVGVDDDSEYFQYDTTQGLRLKSTNIIDISNNLNANKLYFSPTPNSSYLSMNSGKQQIGRVTDSINTNYGGFFFGDTTISNKNFFKYNQEDKSSMFAGKYFNETAYVSTKEEFISALDITISTDGFSITAGSFVIGNNYEITSVGTTDFTSIGASSNTVGVVFTATGIGSGNGTVEGVNTFKFINNNGLKIKRIEVIDSFDVSTINSLHFGTTDTIIPNSDINEIIGMGNVSIILTGLILDLSNYNIKIYNTIIDGIGDGTDAINLGNTGNVEYVTIKNINGKIKTPGVLLSSGIDSSIRNIYLENPNTNYSGEIFSNIVNLENVYSYLSSTNHKSFTIFKGCYSMSNIFLDVVGSTSVELNKITCFDSCNNISNVVIVENGNGVKNHFKDSSIISNFILIPTNSNTYVFDGCSNVSNGGIVFTNCKIKNTSFITNVSATGLTITFEGTISNDINNSWNKYTPSSWTAVSTNLRDDTITITHNLNTTLLNLVVKFLWSSTGADTDAIELGNYFPSAYGADSGFEVRYKTANSIDIVTATYGVWTKVGEITSGYYKVVVTKI